MLRARNPQPGLGHEVTERQRHRQLVPAPGHERSDLAQHHLKRRMVLQQVMDLYQRHPSPRPPRLGRHMSPQQRCLPQVHPSTGYCQQLSLRISAV